MIDGTAFATATCDCGGETVAAVGNIVSRMTTSCGCVLGKAITVHGLSGTTIYQTWAAMIHRCTIQEDRAWENYGGRGITVCASWLSSVENFSADMGEKPTPKHSIDRSNNDGGYWCGKCPECISFGRPSNCRWATAKEQAANKRASSRTRYLTFNGMTLNCADWARRCGVSRQRIEQKLSAGYPIERVLAPRRT
jgi:hypothetical protein